MATSYINLTGKARYVKNIFQPDEAFGASKFKAGIYLDDENLQKYKNSGIQVSIKEDENGKYVVLSRDEVKMINKNLVYFTPPYIKNKDTSYRVHYTNNNGEMVRQYSDAKDKDKIQRIGEPFMIGNGSLIELNVCIFDTKTKGKGHRLEGIRIIDLIEYVPKAQEPVSEGPEVSVINSVEETPETPVVEEKKKDKKAPF